MNGVSDCLDQVGLPEADAAVDEKRVVGARRRLGDWELLRELGVAEDVMAILAPKSEAGARVMLSVMGGAPTQTVVPPLRVDITAVEIKDPRPAHSNA